MSAGVEPATRERVGRRGAGAAVALALVVAAGGVARVLPLRRVYTPEGVRFLDSDPYYHLLRAQRIAQDFPHVPWVDPAMNWPDGAVIPWPPLFDQLVAAPAWLASGGHPTDALVQGVGIWLPVVLGVLLLPLVAALGAALLGGGPAVLAVLLVALLPAQVDYAIVGRADQHVLEILVCCALFLAFLKAAGPGRAGARRWPSAVLSAALVALAFWNWMGSGLYLVVLGLFTGAWHVVAPRDDPEPGRVPAALAAAGAGGAVLLSASLALLGPPGALGAMRLAGLTGFHAAQAGLAGAFGAVLWALERRRGAPASRARRAAEVLLAAAIPGALALLFPPFRGAVDHGLAALARGNSWYRSIGEFEPLLFGGYRPLGADALHALRHYGFTLLAMPFAAPLLVRAWRRRPADRTAVLFTALWGGFFLPLAIASRRFDLYLSVPLALWCELLLRELPALAERRVPGLRPGLRGALPIAGALLLLAPALPGVARGTSMEALVTRDLVPVLEWLRGEPGGPGREAVLASWQWGHAVQYLARKPVVATPFGTEGGERALEDASSFFLERDPTATEALLARRRVGFLLLGDLAEEVVQGVAPPPGAADLVPVRFHWLRGFSFRVDPALLDLVASRLYYLDGLPAKGGMGEALGGYRLLSESPTVENRFGHGVSQLKVFGVVPGAWATVSGARPGARVEARASLRTDRGRSFEWVTAASADGSGRARLRLPYATGRNGRVVAAPYAVGDGERRRGLFLTEGQVAGGAEVALDLGG